MKDKVCFKFKTKISVANTNGKSLKTVIPKEIVDLFKLKPKTFIEWIIEISPNNEIKVCIKPVREDSNENIS